MGLLGHEKGATRPDFRPKGELYHVPSAAKLIREPQAGLDLTYGPAVCRIRVRPGNDRMLEYMVEATSTTDLPVAAHLTLLPHLNEPLETGGGKRVTLGEEAVDWSADEVAGTVTHAGYRLHVPKSATVHWPALPHNPYRKDGRATPAEGRIEIRVPFNDQHRKHTIVVEILK